jgi:toxin ParE1/3/4
MSHAVYAPKAEDDLIGIADYIARDKPEAARRWVQRIRETCDTLATQPEMGELRSEFGAAGCRSFSVGNYAIFFRPTDTGIEVARVVHGSRDIRNP